MEESEKKSESDKKVDEDFNTISCEFDFSDPGSWPTTLAHNVINLLVEKGPVQIHNNYSVDEKKRKFYVNLFTKIWPNGEQIKKVGVCILLTQMQRFVSVVKFLVHTFRIFRQGSYVRLFCRTCCTQKKGPKSVCV